MIQVTEIDDAMKQTAGSRIMDSIKSKVATSLREAAGRLRAGATGETDREPSALGQRAAEWLDQSADYVHQVDLQQVKADVAETVRRNPGRSLLVAGAVGLFLGALFRRR